MTLKFNDPYHIDPDTQRIAVPLIFAYEQLDADCYKYLYDREAADMGLDPWRMIDGFDKHVTHPNTFDIWLVARSTPIFLKDADVLRKVVYTSQKNLPEGFVVPVGTTKEVSHTDNKHRTYGEMSYNEVKFSHARHTALNQCLDAENACFLLNREFNIDEFLKQVKDSYLEYRNT